MKDKLLFFLLFTNLSFGQLSPYEINGYVKYLFSSSKPQQVSERYDDHLIHARLNTRWYTFNNFRAVMEIRLRGYFGESVEKIPNFTEEIKGKYDFLNIDALLWNEKNSVGYGEIDRLYLDWNYNKMQLTLGRQRIAWGTSWTWNPTDIFNPLSVLDFDYEERPAVDAIRAQYYTGAVSKVEFAFMPAKEKENIIAAGLMSFNMWDYDFNLISGIKNKRWLTGMGWTGDIAGAGFRGEILISKGKKTQLSSLNHSFGSDGTVHSIVLSCDYTFPNTFYIHTEVLHNSVGTTEKTARYQQEALNLGMLTAARWSLYQELAYDFHPLVRGTIFGIFNPDDQSFIIVPSASYSVITDLDLLLLGMFCSGNSLSEFGTYDNIAFIRLKYSF